MRRRVYAGVPWTLALAELQLLIEWYGGMPAVEFACYAAACAVTIPLAYLAVAVALARLEWRYSPIVDR